MFERESSRSIESTMSSFERAIELDDQVSDEIARKYAYAGGDLPMEIQVVDKETLLHVMIDRKDVVGRAYQIHEKEEVWQMSKKLGVTVDEVPELKVIVQKEGEMTPQTEAHDEAIRTQYSFLMHCAHQMGFDTTMEALALCSPVSMDYFRALVKNPNLRYQTVKMQDQEYTLTSVALTFPDMLLKELDDAGLKKGEPTREQCQAAVAFYKACGADSQMPIRFMFG